MAREPRFSTGGPGFIGRALRPNPEQLAAREERAATLRAAAERRQETRRRIIIGGLVLKAAKDDVWWREQVITMINQLHPADMKPFMNWRPD